MSERAQTTLDFAMGVSLFAAVLLFVFAFVPGLLSPFTAGTLEETVTSNRVADGVVGGHLGSPAEPGLLETGCTVWFFEHADDPAEPSPSECRFEGGTLQERLGVHDHQWVNITVTGNTTASVGGSSLVCWDANERRVAERGSGNCGGSDDVVLTAGRSPPEGNDDAITATRVATISGEAVTVSVELW